MSMAYNRDWDSGKDWNGAGFDHGSWNNGSGVRDNIRTRDDEYYNEGKRRKYNNGVGVPHFFVYCDLSDSVIGL